MAATTCPWCNAPRVAEPSCPRCGANYAKAEQIKKQGKAVPVAPVVASPAPEAVADEPLVAIIAGGIEDRVVEDPALEFKLCVAAIPTALALGVLFHFLTPGMQRIVFGMPLHELGHAVSAWFCGFWAIPTLWKTIIPDERGILFPLVLTGAIAYMMFRAWQAEKLYLVVLGAVLLGLQAIGTLVLRESTAEAVFTFGGDGIGMVLATALMATFFFGKRTQLYKGWLRWGFVCIGAAAFSDMFATWWAARNDFASIPFGEIEGVGSSDALRLTQEHGWSNEVLVRRFVAVGVSCLAALALVYAWGVRVALRKAREAR
jgi:hypothetical protein